MPTIADLNSASQYISICFGLVILIGGLIGNILNVFVFLSLKTFRESSCAFFLTMMSFLNVGQLLTGALPRIVNAWFSIDWQDSSFAYCKARGYLFQICSLVSFTCICFATIDQFLATCSNPRWQRLCNVRLASYIFIISFLIWILHGIPTLMYQTLVISATGSMRCDFSDAIFQKYNNYGIVLVLTSSLPVVLTTIFASLAYRNVRLLAYRTVPMVRRELDRQLTSMVIVQAIVNFYVIVPYIITYMINSTTTFTRNTYEYAVFSLVRNLTLFVFYLYFAVSRKD